MSHVRHNNPPKILIDSSSIKQPLDHNRRWLISGDPKDSTDRIGIGFDHTVGYQLHQSGGDSSGSHRKLSLDLIECEPVAYITCQNAKNVPGGNRSNVAFDECQEGGVCLGSVTRV